MFVSRKEFNLFFGARGECKESIMDIYENEGDPVVRPDGPHGPFGF